MDSNLFQQLKKMRLLTALASRDYSFGMTNITQAGKWRRAP